MNSVKKYSGKAVNRAGEDLVSSLDEDDFSKFEAAMATLSYWRFSHERALEEAFQLLQKTASKKDKTAIFAKRLKRFPSIVGKLRRFEKMKLKNMQDIGGCRAVLNSTKKVDQVARELRKRPEFKNGGSIRCKDYIREPKEDGYRGYHIIGHFNNSEGESRNIEIQLRTRLQHCWATALEIIDIFTGQALKSNIGEKDWKEFFIHVSGQFALMDSIHLFRDKSDDEKLTLYEEILSNNVASMASSIEVERYRKKLSVDRKLQSFAHSVRIVDQQVQEDDVQGYVLLEIDTDGGTVTTTLFPEESSKEAEEYYTSAEKASADSTSMVVALVSTTAVGGVKEAYPNFFADSTEFIANLSIVFSAVERAGRPNSFVSWLKKANLG